MFHLVEAVGKQWRAHLEDPERQALAHGREVQHERHGGGARTRIGKPLKLGREHDALLPR